MPQAAGPETVIRKSNSWPTRTALADTSAWRVKRPIPPRNAAGRPAAGTGRTSTLRLWLRPERSSTRTGIDGICSVPGRVGTRRNRVTKSILFADDRADRRSTDRSAVGADLPGSCGWDGGKIDLGWVAPAGDTDPEFDSLAHKVRPAADVGLDVNGIVGRLRDNRPW